LEEALLRFVAQWTSHQRQLSACGELHHRQFIILAVDEDQAGASGCSIDRSVRFLHEVEEAFGVSLFDRMRFAWWDDGTVRTADSQAFADLYRGGGVGPDTLVFDNLVKTRGEWTDGWLKPLAKSWHRRFV
jgi:hypothetical protein